MHLHCSAHCYITGTVAQCACQCLSLSWVRSSQVLNQLLLFLSLFLRVVLHLESLAKVWTVSVSGNYS